METDDNKCKRQPDYDYKNILTAGGIALLFAEKPNGDRIFVPEVYFEAN